MFPGIAKLAGNIQNYLAASVAKRGIIVLENKGSLKPTLNKPTFEEVWGDF